MVNPGDMGYTGGQPYTQYFDTSGNTVFPTGAGFTTYSGGESKPTSGQVYYIGPDYNKVFVNNGIGNPSAAGTGNGAGASSNSSAFQTLANPSYNSPIISQNQAVAQNLINQYAAQPNSPMRQQQFQPNPFLKQGNPPADGMAKGGIPRPRRATGFGPPTGGGLLRHPSGGRADALNTALKPNSFVIPADVVSGLGGGNTENGAMLLKNMFGQKAPYQGVQSPAALAKGGAVTEAVPVKLSGGEVVITPEEVAEIGKGDIQEGLRILHKFILLAREKTIKDMRSLKPPSK